MSGEIIKHNDKKIFLTTIIICLIVSFLIAFWAAQSTNSFGVTVIFYIVFFLLGIPIGIISIIASVICFSTQNYKVYGFALVFSLILLPIGSISFLKLMEWTKLAKYTQPSTEANKDYDSRPFESKITDSIVIVFKNNTTQEEKQKFEETNLKKIDQQIDGINYFTFADGVCRVAYSGTVHKFDITEVGFCNDASIEQKKKITDSIKSSPIVEQLFENMQEKDIEELRLGKRYNKN
jgi:hypothetical protein